MIINATFLGRHGEAKRLGIRYYYCGRTCRRGHMSPHYTVSGDCIACTLERRAAVRARSAAELRQAERDRRLRDPEKSKEAKRRQRAEDPDKVRRWDRARHLRDHEKRSAANKRWRENNPERAKENARRWQKLNPASRVRACALRREKLRNATPKWLTPEQIAAIYAIYAAAERLTKETGVRHDVDHILPLRHRLCCGLHVPWNLQILTRDANKKKGNTMPLGLCLATVKSMKLRGNT